ncbi:hypothetical protein EVAR_38349_1 [Eumeta japonica]|uniref:Uncharacterized protein n=1 Tax=Eumeta variegata TaxID=151549 RepID=A0A4C1XVE7_EUMVA|nr:hypothetical protein EVAR_38349_1 [Eumeta japonica]
MWRVLYAEAGHPAVRPSAAQEIQCIGRPVFPVRRCACAGNEQIQLSTLGRTGRARGRLSTSRPPRLVSCPRRIRLARYGHLACKCSRYRSAEQRNYKFEIGAMKQVSPLIDIYFLYYHLMRHRNGSVARLLLRLVNPRTVTSATIAGNYTSGAPLVIGSRTCAWASVRACLFLGDIRDGGRDVGDLNRRARTCAAPTPGRLATILRTEYGTRA